MDETTLSDLLECSVCLEQLDIASKVLPCQHTFCRKCLEVIVASKKELKCPECRIVVKLPIDELPPNVLLVRILEGMKNSASLKANNSKSPRSNNAAQPDKAEKIQTSDATKQSFNAKEKLEAEASVKQASEIKRYSLGNVPQQKRYILPHAYAVYDFPKNEPNILSFKKGDLILLKGNIDKDWCFGQCNGKEGKFPIKFVKIVVPLPSPQCVALYDFKMAPNEDEGCLSFKKGTIIQVIRRVDQNWAEGSIGASIGIFPIAFVELNNLAKQILMQSNKSYEIKHHIPKQLGNPNYNLSVQNNQSLNSKQSNDNNITSQTNRGTFGNSTNYCMNPSRSVDSLCSQSISPNEKHIPDNIFTANDSVTFRDSKRHSLHSLVSSQNSSAVNSNRYSAEILSAPSACNTNDNDAFNKNRAPQGVTPKLPWSAVALYPYQPKNRDELELKKGCIYMVTEICLDGWYKGKNKNEEFGVFPGNYVTPLSYMEQRKYALDTKSSPQNVPPAAATLLNPKSLSKSLNFLETTNNRRELHLPALPPRTTFHETSSSLTCGNVVENTMEPTANKSHNTLHPNTIHPLQEIKDEELKTKNNSSSGALNLMKRLANIKYQNKTKTASRSKTYQNNLTENVKCNDMQDIYNTQSLDQNNPNNNASSTLKAIHIRSGSCPSQLLQTNALQVNAAENFRENIYLQQTQRSPILFASNSQRHKVKDRPTIVGRKSLDGASLNLLSSKTINTNHRDSIGEPQNTTGSCVISHRKSSSFDASHMLNTTSTMLPHCAESGSGIKTENRFRCIVPYPPNSDIELELHVGDIVYVQRKQKNGWYKGTNSITNKTGLFPASFVELDT